MNQPAVLYTAQGIPWRREAHRASRSGGFYPYTPASTPPVSSPPEAGKHHVMVRGIERRAAFRDDRDRQDFAQRLGALAGQAGWRVYAWALLPNHLHLLVRMGRRPVATAPAAIGAVAVSGLGLPVTRVARALAVTPMPLLRGVPRGRMLLQARKLDMAALAREAQKG